MMKSKVLVIDDEPDIRELLQLTLTRMGLKCDVVANCQEGMAAINQHHHYFLVLTDMRMPDGDGGSIVHYIQKNYPQLPVAVITAYGNVESAVSMLKAGAFDYVSKPVDLEVLRALVNTALKMSKQAQAEEGLLLGESTVMQALRNNILKVARSQAPVFIKGESGVGKELVARMIHLNGPRRDKPFIPVNCGAIPNELMESEFFGHKKGSFTGAIADKPGLFAAAQAGTLFLDEIAELPLAMQVKLLRAIQEKAIKPVGDSIEMAVDVRILSASNKNLLEEISAGRFRQELYYRINVIELRVPTLQERASDIPLLANAILQKLALEQQVPPLKLQPACLSLLKSYSFPGNVRELENILERAMAMSNGITIELEDLQLPEPSAIVLTEDTSPHLKLDSQLIEHEKTLILEALEKTKWNRTAAARLLGVSFRTLRYRLKKLGIE